MYRYDYSNETSTRKSNDKLAPESNPRDKLEQLTAAVRADIIGSSSSDKGKHIALRSPIDDFRRGIIYADFTASGRSLMSIERYIIDRVLPWYGNTHSVASGTARQTTHFREEARYIIRNYFNCNEHNAVVFAGSGVTGGIMKFLTIIESGVREGFLFQKTLGLDDMRSFLIEDRWGSLMCKLCDVRLKNEAAFRSHCHTAIHQEKVSASLITPNHHRTKILFLIDSINHHSSMLPFRELANRYPNQIETRSIELASIPSVVSTIDPTQTLVIGVLCAMSNITGYGPSTDEILTINESIHSIEGLVSWDLATFVCHHKFDMNPSNRPKAYSDFVFVSPHKLVGGPGSSGIMIGRKEWMKNSIPTVPGGGAVFFASEKSQAYIQNTQEREEAGTPDILGCIRAGLVFGLHEKLNMQHCHDMELELARKLFSIIQSDPRIHILGTQDKVSPLISFSIEFGNNLFLHYNFVVSVLNDLFGIQARGGCACAGPYAQKLLGLSEQTTDRFNECLQRSGQEVFRPGFVRLGVHWTMTEEEVGIIGNALLWIAQHGWRLLSVYQVDIETGEWKHRVSNHESERQWLSDSLYLGDLSTVASSSQSVGELDVVPLNELMVSADRALTNIHAKVPLGSVRNATTDSRYEDLVWFAMPMDSRNAIESGLIGTSSRTRIIHPTDVMVDEETSVVETVASPKAKRQKKFQVPRKLRVLATSAILDYSMIKEGDKVLIGISGGKDSLSLLHILLECQRKCPFKFEIAAATVDPQVPEYQPHALVDYMASLGVKYHFLSQPIVEIAKSAMTGKQSICAFCSRMKRGMLYRCMRENGYNVLALGQHLDDLVESFLMSCFRNGAMRTMKANYFVKERDLRVIRPLIYVREKMTADFASEAQLPIIRDNCPACFSAPKERHRIKVLLSHEEFQNPHLFASMLQSMKPIIGISNALSTKELIESKMFPFGDMDDEDDDRGAEETLLPCSDGVCPLPNKNQ
jgi:selenocysteine lyase/cysteine desulfurase/tRNA(Ile)-lysidine synthase TilS/MesJ